MIQEVQTLAPVRRVERTGMSLKRRQDELIKRKMKRSLRLGSPTNTDPIIKAVPAAIVTAKRDPERAAAVVARRDQRLKRNPDINKTSLETTKVPHILGELLDLFVCLFSVSLLLLIMIRSVNGYASTYFELL
jgi:hypothetical protein